MLSLLCTLRNSRLVSLPLLVFLLLVAAGCPSTVAKDNVSGKVTVAGEKVVMGTITFIGADGKTATGNITPTGYVVENPPKGECKITIKGMGLTLNAPVKDSSKDSEKVTKDMKMETPAMGATPPKKYESPENGLKFTVTSGKQKHDIDLSN